MDDKKKTITIWVDEDTHTKFKSVCASIGKTMTDVLEKPVLKQMDRIINNGPHTPAKRIKREDS
jgi:antitoxin component of RelBE/YafQ-DinJ toxin-antitoxin module